MKCLDCLFIGSSTRDIMMLVESPPRSDARIAASKMVRSFGGVSNIAAFAHNSLGGVTGVITTVGGDDTAGEIVAFQKRQNLAYLDVHAFDEAASSTSLIQVEMDGKRTITHYGGCMDQLKWDMIEKEPFHNTRIVHIGVMPFDLMMQVLRYVKSETSALVSIDGGNFTKEVQEAILPYTDIFIPDNKTVRNYLDLDEMEGVAYYLRQGVRFACVTSAEKGAFASDGTGMFHVSAITGQKIVDTTGAGDNFHGAFLYGIGQGMSYPEAVRFASCYATLTCADLGGPTVAPSVEQVNAVIHDSEITWIR